ncbi:MerR family transcriptional regulator [Saccharopolyspora sp. NPDC047091]|uniref:MerR family transcriptional regulator n=1 Tax=Saccharopolyspora sp. NPDC047091 TaxID=3155924 RepID=UPI0033DA212F
MAEYRIDDLARAAGTTVRNVRVYQDRELLPAPRREGRLAIYSDAHLVRLRMIINMLGRGYAFAQIREMLSAWESGRSLAEVLGLEEVMGESWAEQSPRVYSLSQLREMFRGQLNQQNIRRAIELNLLERWGARFVAPSPQLLDAGSELVRLGVPLAEVLELAEQLQADVDHVSESLVSLVRTHVLEPADTAWDDAEVARYTEVVRRLRPLAMSALNAAAARSAERVIPDILGDRLVALLRDQENPGEAG